MNKFCNYNQKGFTIIETLIAISVLMISIAGPLVIANRGLTSALYAKNQSIASALALEGMEMIRNIKDTAMYTDPSGPATGFDQLFKSGESAFMKKCPGVSGYGPQPSPNAMSSNAYCGMDLPSGTDASPEYYSCRDKPGECQLFIDYSQGIGYLPSCTTCTQLTPFTRYFYVTPISGTNKTEYQVTVVVNWLQGNNLNQVVLEENMTATIQ